MTHLRMAFRCLCSVTLVTAAHAQAAVEYAAKSATGAVSGAASSPHLGACPLDSTLVPCLRQFYPATFYAAVAIICVLLLGLIYPKRRV